jgi:pyruvate/2-oxoglutarate dehydrogenase complex dihydrolipoamide acyltransferase (E2) component
VAGIRSVGWPPSGWNTWPPWIGIHNYGPIAADGTVEVFFSFDHRVMDGMAGAKAVQALERMLHGPVLAELQASAAPG